MHGNSGPAAAISVSGGSKVARPGARYRLAVAALLGLILALAGGASRYDEAQQLVVRLAAIGAIVATLWPLETGVLRSHRRLLAAMVAAIALVLLQLVPLPPALWARLPGHEVYANIAEAVGAVAWRPLSLTPDLTLNALFALLPPVAAVLAALHLDTRARLRLIQGIIVVACVSGVLGLLQLAAGDGLLRLFRETSADSPVGLFANRNHQAALLACALPLTGAAAAIAMRDGAAQGMLVAAPAVIALLLAALVAAGSRMGLVLALLGLAGAAWAWRAAGGRLPRPTPRSLALGAIVSVPALGLLGLLAVRSGAVTRLLAVDGVTESRAAMLAPLLETARAFLPFGAGFGSFDSVYRRFEPDALLSTIYMNQAHNEPLQLAIEGGVPALLLLALFGWWWVRTARRAVAPRVPPRHRAMGIAVATVGLILMASSLVDYPLRTPLLAGLFAFAGIAMLRAAERAVSASRP